MVLVQKWPFLKLFFLGSIGQENVFYDIPEQKNTFQAYKKKSSKTRKIDIFPKGVNPCFGPKMAIFPTFLFTKYRAKNIQNKKTPFKPIRTRSSKTPKIDIFPNGLTHGFGPKMAIFPTFLFRQYRLGKCL